VEPWKLNEFVANTKEVIAPGAEAGIVARHADRYKPWLPDRYANPRNLTKQFPVAIYPTHFARRTIGPIRSAVLLGILQSPHRFRTKRQLWTYSGFGIETQSSADHRSVDGQLERAKKQISVRGLNRNCNHDLKNLFKGAAILASSKPGPFPEFYTALLTKGIRPEMARLTLARKIATIVLIVWKRGACFDAQHLKPQTA